MHRLRRQLGPAIWLALALAARSAPAQAWTFDWAGRVDLDAEGLRADDPAVRREAVQQLSGYDITLTEPYLLAALTDTVLDVRLDAARALGRGGSQRAVPVLIEWLGDVEIKTRTTAAEALGDIGGPQAAAALTRSLGDPDHGVRQRAVRALGAIGKRGDPTAMLALLPRLSDDKADVRRETVEQLEGIADRRAVIPLVAAFSDNHPEVRKAAVRAIGRFGDATVVPALLRLLRDSSEDVRTAAVGSLGSIGSAQAIGALSDLLASGSDVFRSKVAYALGQIARDPSAGKAGEVALERLVTALATSALRTAAREALRVAGAAAIPALLAHLAGKLPGDPTTAVQLLARSADGRATLALTAELERRRVALPIVLEALGATGDPTALIPVLSTLSSKDPEIRLAAMNALRPLLGDDGRASDVLIERLGDPELEVRVLAAEYLGVVRAREAAQPLIALTAATAPDRLRRAAVDALGLIGEPRGLPALLRILREGPSSLRPAAATAISYIGDASALPLLLQLLADRDDPDRRFTIRALAGSLRSLRARRQPTAPAAAPPATAAIAALIRLSEDSSTPVAIAAIAALAAAGDPAALPGLRTLAGRGAPDRRRAALTALADLGEGEARALALEALGAKDDRVAADAAWVATSLAMTAEAAARESTWDRLSFAAKGGGWATAISAAAGLARLAPLISPTAMTPERLAALHLLSFHRSRLVRCNLGLALLALPQDGSPQLRKDLLRLLAEDVSSRVRATIAGALSRRRATAKLPAALAEALSGRAADPSELVRSAAATFEATPGAPPQWRIFEIVDADSNDAPARQQPYFLQGGDGVVRGVYTDANGEITGEHMSAIDVVVLPASREADF